MRFIFKIIFFALTLFFNFNTATAQIIEIKLNCQISLSAEYSTGFREQTQISDIIEIMQTNNYLSIIPSSSELTSVSTGIGRDVSNFSDQNKWDLSNEKNGTKTQITIDRNTGKIFYYRYFKGERASIMFTGYGNCFKVDTNKKMF